MERKPKTKHSKLSLYLSYFSLVFVTYEATLNNALTEGAKIQVAFGLIGLIYIALSSKNETLNPLRYKFQDITSRDIMFGIALGIAAVIIQKLTNSFGSVSSTELAVYYISAATLEELFFRGTLLELLFRVTKNQYVSALLCSAAFAGAHYNYYSMPNVLLALFLWSMLICLVYFKTSLTAVMIGHLLLNTLKAITVLQYGVTLR